eukprot:1156298-Pelagomonas_calceolata.AAC.7
MPVKAFNDRLMSLLCLSQLDSALQGMTKSGQGRGEKAKAHQHLPKQGGKGYKAVPAYEGSVSAAKKSPVTKPIRSGGQEQYECLLLS